jgi:hypothetical protein
MNNKHACVYYKDKLYTVCHYFSIHTIDEREYVLRHGYSPDIREKSLKYYPSSCVVFLRENTLYYLVSVRIVLTGYFKDCIR